MVGNIDHILRPYDFIALQVDRSRVILLKPIIDVPSNTLFMIVLMAYSSIILNYEVIRGEGKRRREIND